MCRETFQDIFAPLLHAHRLPLPCCIYIQKMSKRSCGLINLKVRSFLNVSPIINGVRLKREILINAFTFHPNHCKTKGTSKTLQKNTRCVCSGVEFWNCFASRICKKRKISFTLNSGMFHFHAALHPLLFCTFTPLHVALCFLIEFRLFESVAVAAAKQNCCTNKSGPYFVVLPEQENFCSFRNYELWPGYIRLNFHFHSHTPGAARPCRIFTLTGRTVKANDEGLTI